MSSRIIMQLYEDSLTLRISDLGILFNKQTKLNKIKWLSKQNTYHLVNKNIAPSKVTDERRRKRGCLPGHPQA